MYIIVNRFSKNNENNRLKVEELNNRFKIPESRNRIIGDVSSIISQGLDGVPETLLQLVDECLPVYAQNQREHHDRHEQRQKPISSPPNNSI